MLSTYFYARRIQEIEKERLGSRAMARHEAEAQVQALKAQAEVLDARLEQATAPRRRNRPLR